MKFFSWRVMLLIFLSSHLRSATEFGAMQPALVCQSALGLETHSKNEEQIEYLQSHTYYMGFFHLEGCRIALLIVY